MQQSIPMKPNNNAYRTPSGVSGLIRSYVGSSSQRKLATWAKLVPRIAALEEEYQNLDDEKLRRESRSLQYEAKSGVKLIKLLPQAFALVREAARRTINLRHYDVQMLGGAALVNESFAEMQTGEGKTLVATLPLYLYALSGKGAHLATVNDYLAKRDAEWMTPIYTALGMAVGVVQSDDPREARFAAYACDVTYGTAKEFGFDFLRDQLMMRETGDNKKRFLRKSASADISKQPLCDDPNFILIDEADSILIDEARTPLIIGAFDEARKEQLEACYKWAAEAVVDGKFVEKEHYKYDHDKRSVELNVDGRQMLRLLRAPEIVEAVGLLELYQFIERAIKVRRDFQLDREYVVRDGDEGPEIVIVDEFTGRLAEGRKWRAGIHQAIEAKEGVPVTVGTGQAARITMQDLITRYPHIAGMTGTCTTSATEMRKVYHRGVVAIPTNRPPRRERLPDRIFPTTADKWQAVVEEVREIHATGRPVLIGTRSIDKSMQLSGYLQEAGIVPHAVLNAHEIAKEAEIVAQAGRLGAVTIATNMAGRGTDIILGGNPEHLAMHELSQENPAYVTRLDVPREVWDKKVAEVAKKYQMKEQGVKVCELGGLHVICTELHDSLRIDRQLIGRCGRQGDPGTFRQYLAMDDDILRSGYGKDKAERMKPKINGTELRTGGYLGRFIRAQKRVEKEHLRQRVMLNYHEKQRKKMYVAMGQNPYLDVPD